MKILQFDSIGGASGDMILGALFELGIEPSRLQAALSSLVPEAFEIRAGPFGSHGLHGTRVEISIPHHGHSHEHRTFKDIAAIIDAGDLPDRVKKQSKSVFLKLAGAEALIHGTTADTVHFHEVGAVDSIVDIVGCCLAKEWLEIDQVLVGPLPAGHGTIQCAHGIYPSPAPAVVELLKGHPLVQIDEPFELVTPTGAALLTEWKTLDTLPAGSRIVKAGYSFGHRALNTRPNVLRAILLETASTSESIGDTCLVLESNIDDTNPELLGALALKLFGAGALDVFTTAAQMKKQRPGTLLTVLCKPDQRARLLDLIFKESTTFGVREYPVSRTVLSRRLVGVQTEFGEVQVKVGIWQGSEVTFAPEMDDCIRAAERRNIPVRQVYEAALVAAQHLRDHNETKGSQGG